MISCLNIKQLVHVESGELRQVVFFWSLANPDLSIRLPYSKAINHSQNKFPLLHSSVVLYITPVHPTLVIVLGDVRLACSCLAMETYAMNLVARSFVLMSMP